MQAAAVLVTALVENSRHARIPFDNKQLGLVERERWRTGGFAKPILSCQIPARSLHYSNYAKFFRLGELCKFWSTSSTDAAEEWRLSSNLLGKVQLAADLFVFRVSRMVIGPFRQDMSRLSLVAQRYL
jgi:hypothetical protein